jgi:hypothetical protein
VAVISSPAGGPRSGVALETRLALPAQTTVIRVRTPFGGVEWPSPQQYGRAFSISLGQSMPPPAYVARVASSMSRALDSSQIGFLGVLRVCSGEWVKVHLVRNRSRTASGEWFHGSVRA